MKTLRHRGLSIMAALLLPWFASAGHAQALQQGDRVLLDMRQAFTKGNTSQLSAMLPSLKGHPLEPLAAYWEIKSRLETASPDDIRSFLRRYAGTYYEDRLRNDWLLLLGKAGDWNTFLEELPRFRMNDDREVQCYDLLARREAVGAFAADQLRDLWLAQKRADDGCATAVAAWIASGQLPEAVAWQRARWGMEYGKADVVTQAVAMVDAEAVSLAQSLYANPQPYLDGKLTALRGQTKQMVTLALVRLAVRDPDAAADAADKLRWRTQLTEEERSWVWGVIGKRLAQRLSPDALEAFGHARDTYLDEEHLAWKARAAIRASSWTQVSGAINAMGERQQREPTWVYWQAKALQAKGDNASRQNAFLLLRQISGTDGFYEQLALEALGNDVTVPPSPAPLTETEKSAARQDEGLQRALKAIAIGLRSEGVREWNYTVALHSPGGMSERELLAAADLACQHQVWDRCINTSTRTGSSIDHAQRYPTPYREQVVQRAREISLDPAYVYGLIRQESRFVMDARSGVGASGLMQVMPATAKWTAKRIGLVNFKPHHISDRDTNITIGTAYLKLALDDFEGSMALAAAAYNAGPSRARAWRDGPTLDAAAWIENIPFDETRDYVKRVLANTTNYAAVLTGEPQRLSARLAPIGPRPTSSPASNDDLP